MLPDQARPLLLAAVRTARDRLVVTWLADGGLRIGELTGLHLADLHLRADAACGQCAAPHVHVCHRPGNPNRAAARTKPDWLVTGGVVTGGLVRRASPAMVHSYFEYLTGEYPRPGTGHGMLLVQLAARVPGSRGRRTRRGGCCAAPVPAPGWDRGSGRTCSVTRSPRLCK